MSLGLGRLGLYLGARPGGGGSSPPVPADAITDPRDGYAGIPITDPRPGYEGQYITDPRT